MTILKIIFVLLLCIPLIYVSIILLDRLLEEYIRKQKQTKVIERQEIDNRKGRRKRR